MNAPNFVKYNERRNLIEIKPRDKQYIGLHLIGMK